MEYCNIERQIMMNIITQTLSLDINILAIEYDRKSP
jgi:hypothetical protein